MSDFAASAYAHTARAFTAPAFVRPKLSVLSVAAVLLPLLMLASAMVPPHPDLSAAEIYTLAE